MIIIMTIFLPCCLLFFLFLSHCKDCSELLNNIMHDKDLKMLSFKQSVSRQFVANHRKTHLIFFNFVDLL